MLATELRKRNFEIIFAGENQSPFITEKGFEIIPVYEPDPRKLFGNIRDGKLQFVTEDEVEKMVQADLSIYRDVQPDVVLSDGRFTAPISTQLANLKHAAIVNVSSTEYRAHPYVPLLDWIPAEVVGRDAPLWKRIELLNIRLEMAIFDNAMRVFKRLSKRLGLKLPITATNCLTGKDMTLLADVPEYFPARNLPPNYHYIGPLTLRTDMEPPAWWPPKRRNGRLVYLTMGTTGIGEFFYDVYEMLQNADFTAVVTTGAQVEDLKNIEGVVYLEKFMDGDLIMENCDLVVCHGGNGTIYQALQHGKPVIGIPTIPDQKFNMRRVESLGVGLTVAWKDFASNPEVLMEAIQRVLEKKRFTQNAVKMKSIIAGYDSQKLGADIIEKFLLQP